MKLNIISAKMQTHQNEGININKGDNYGVTKSANESFTLPELINKSGTRLQLPLPTLRGMTPLPLPNFSHRTGGIPLVSSMSSSSSSSGDKTSTNFNQFLLSQLQNKIVKDSESIESSEAASLPHLPCATESSVTTTAPVATTTTTTPLLVKNFVIPSLKSANNLPTLNDQEVGPKLTTALNVNVISSGITKINLHNDDDNHLKTKTTKAITTPQTNTLESPLIDLTTALMINCPAPAAAPVSNTNIPANCIINEKQQSCDDSYEESDSSSLEYFYLEPAAFSSIDSKKLNNQKGTESSITGNNYKLKEERRRRKRSADFILPTTYILSPKLHKKQQSGFAAIIGLQYKVDRNYNFQNHFKTKYYIEHFKFDTKSPDDLVEAALKKYERTNTT